MHWNKNKFKVSPPEQRKFNGKTYASKAEMQYAMFLWDQLNHEDGSIVLIIEQPRVWLGVPENVYVPDFFVVDKVDGQYFVDVKGMRTPAFNKNVKLWKNYGMSDLHIVTKKGNKWQKEIIARPTKL